MQRKSRPILRAIGAGIFTLALVMLSPTVSHAQKGGGPPTTTPPVIKPPVITPPTTKPPKVSVPEPSTNLLLLIGLGMTGLTASYMQYRKRRA